MNPLNLFNQLFLSSTESQVDEVSKSLTMHSSRTDWHPYGDNESNFSVVENQQASPIPALVEKIINSIDAILMRRCLEEEIDPRSKEAPRSVEDAVQRFFPKSSNWDLPAFRKAQAEHIQIVADGPKLTPSLVIYDDGEGQHPEDFKDTFLSLLRGNKNEIHFVQGKYNMGGAGAIVFCGKRHYQLIGSKRFDGTGEFGFTLLRRHPLSTEEKEVKKNTWYEYLVIDGKIPSFPIEELDLGLHNRKFRTGTIIKLYSYDLPSGSRSVISRDLNQSLNEYLFNSALPILTVDKPERYPDDRNLERDLYGLQRRLESERNKYVQESFSENVRIEGIGLIIVTCYVFNARIEGKDVSESKKSIRREFFKNNMTVLFSVNGQVHGNYTSEFVTRALKMQILKDYVLIHVDCTDIDQDFRNELFMASRDRLKDGQESQTLRSELAKVLSKSRLQEIFKNRKSMLSVESKDTEDLIRNFTRNLPLQHDLMRLLGQTFKLQKKEDGQNRRKQAKKETEEPNEPAFQPQRFPSFFKLDRKSENGITLYKVPLGGERTIRFSTDVEDQYFDRISEPGELKLAVLSIGNNESSGGTKAGLPDKVEDLLNVIKSSPHNGSIRIAMTPTQTANVGDTIKIRAELTGAGKSFEEIFLVKITDPEKQKKKSKEGKEEPDMNIGLPKLIVVYETAGDNSERITWENVESSGIEMDHSVVVHPSIDAEDTLSEVYINRDSSVLRNYLSKFKNASENQIEISEKRYISSVYFHALFLYMITRNRKYTFQRERSENEPPEDIDLVDYLKDVFSSHYAEFLLNFEMQEVMASLES